MAPIQPVQTTNKTSKIVEVTLITLQASSLELPVRAGGCLSRWRSGGTWKPYDPSVGEPHETSRQLWNAYQGHQEAMAGDDARTV